LVPKSLLCENIEDVGFLDSHIERPIVISLIESADLISPALDFIDRFGYPSWSFDDSIFIDDSVKIPYSTAILQTSIAYG
jgi:hypothetical protein